MAWVSKVAEIYCCTVCKIVGSSLTLAVQFDAKKSAHCRVISLQQVAFGRRRKKILRDLKARGWYVWRRKTCLPTWNVEASRWKRRKFTQCICPECLLKARNGQEGLRLTESGPGGILGEGAGMSKYVNIEWAEGGTNPGDGTGRMTSVAFERCLRNHRMHVLKLRER